MIPRTTPEWQQLFARRVKVERQRAGWTQAELAIEANVGVSAVRNLEAGRDVKLSTFIAILRALNVDNQLDMLLFSSDSPTPMEQLATLRKMNK